MSHRAKVNRPESCPFASKGGMKLAVALDYFKIDVSNFIVADLGSHQGGFVECLLEHNVAKVYSVDTSYGTLAWKLRQNPKVIVQERTNAVHWRPTELLDFVTIDVAWTPQKYIIPNAMKMIKPEGAILSLLKSQYEPEAKNKVLTKEEVEQVVHNILPWFESLFQNVSYFFSPYIGSGGNQEVWFYLQTKR
jgi:23S rRNA (cytidine1920-2'-O)/16S rRNA (cytidine1409-2'-O)-methyltransferase